KSALTAQFADGLPDGTVILWLDFDRADLAADDPRSMLRALAEQAALQVDGFTFRPARDAAWEDAAKDLAASLSRASGGAGPPLLVLDGFEVAQHAKDHDRVWQLLQVILQGVPGMRVLVAGRASVPDLSLGGRPARHRRLAGMDREAATAWLNESGVDDGEVV